MLVNPYTPEGKRLLATYEGTHIIQEGLGVVGATCIDPSNRFRTWTIHALYSPVRGRIISGIRAKLVDAKGFVTFCNQRDLEVLLDVASPGAYCQWLDQEYVEPLAEGWYGFCADEDDLVDDLYDRELEARALGQPGAMLPYGMSFQRRVHDGYHNDFEEEVMLLGDVFPETGAGPDTRFETVIRRWKSIERTPTIHRSKLWLRL